MNLSKTCKKNKYKYNVQIQQYKEQRGECGSNQAKLSQKFLLSFPPSLSRAELNCGICILSLTRRSYFRFLAQNTFQYSTCQCDFGGLCLNVLNLFLNQQICSCEVCIMDGSDFFLKPKLPKPCSRKVKEKKIFRNMGASCVHVNTSIRSVPRHPLKLGLFPHTMFKECPIGGFEAT